MGGYLKKIYVAETSFHTYLPYKWPYPKVCQQVAVLVYFEMSLFLQCLLATLKSENWILQRFLWDSELLWNALSQELWHLWMWCLIYLHLNECCNASRALNSNKLFTWGTFQTWQMFLTSLPVNEIRFSSFVGYGISEHTETPKHALGGLIMRRTNSAI